VAEMM